MDLLKQYASVHSQFARVAYVTFAANASVDYDDITALKKPFDKCQMFPSVQQDRYLIEISHLYYYSSRKFFNLQTFKRVDNQTHPFQAIAC